MRKTAPLFKTKGFTLIESLVFIGILALLFGLATPYLFGTKEKAQLELERDKIVSALKVSQQNAIAAYKGYDHGIKFNAGQGEYTPFMVNLSEVPPASLSEEKTIKLHPKIEILTVSPSEVVFQRISGRPNTSFALTLASRKFKVEIMISDQGTFKTTKPEKR